MTYPTIMSMEELESLAPADVLAVPVVVPLADTPVTSPGGDPSSTGTSKDEAYREALRISEQARLQLQSQLESRQTNQQQAQPQQKWYTNEELVELLGSDDPAQRFAAIQISNQQAIAIAANHFEQRLAPLQAGNISAAELNARAKYPAEFSVLGDEIKQFADSVPDKSALTSVDGWDRLVGFIRGKSGNFEKMSAHYQKQQGEQIPANNPASARASAAANAGFTAAPLRTPVSPPVSNGLSDAVTAQIAEALGYANPQAYLKDLGITSAFNLNG